MLIVIVYLFSVLNGKHDYPFCTAINISILIKQTLQPKTFIKMIVADEPPSFCFYSFSVFKPTNKCIYLHIRRYRIANQYSFIQSCKCLSAWVCNGFVWKTWHGFACWILFLYIACKRIAQFDLFLHLLLFQLTAALLQNVPQLRIVLLNNILGYWSCQSEGAGVIRPQY